MAIRKRDAEQELARVMLREFPDDAVVVVETAKDAESAALLERESAAVVAGVLRRLTPDRAARILGLLTPESLSGVLGVLSPNRAAALLARLDPTERERCLETVAPTLAAELRELQAYPRDSAGGVMDPRVTTFRVDATPSQVIRRLRKFRDRRINDIYLLSDEGLFAGAVALQDVVLAEPGAHLQDLVSSAVRVEALATREEILQTFSGNRVSSLPVVDFDGHVIGVIRQRDLLQAAAETATASAVTMTGASDQERALSSPWFAVRKRLPWLEVNLLTAFLAASVVGVFEETISRVTALAVLLPVVAGQSGNTGAQALAVTMRGLALREIRVRQWFRVAGKEFLAGAINGVVVALTTGGAVLLWSRSTGLAAVIAVSMILSMALAGLSGAIIPMVLTALHMDPAQSSSIILTTVTDVVGFFSFLGIATVFASML